MTNPEKLVGRTVRQTSASAPEFQKYVGRESTVEEAFADENGNVQVRTADGVWCPEVLLQVLDGEVSAVLITRGGERFQVMVDRASVGVVLRQDTRKVPGLRAFYLSSLGTFSKPAEYTEADAQYVDPAGMPDDRWNDRITNVAGSGLPEMTVARART